MKKRLLVFNATLLFSLILVNYYNSLRDGISWHVQRELCQAARRGDVREMKLLVFLGANPDGWNTTYTPIHFAASSGQLEAIQYLLGEGIDVNSQDKFHWTPLMVATNTNQIEAVRLLLSSGAAVNLAGEDGTALDLAEERGNPELIDVLKQAGAGKKSPVSE